MIFHLNLYLSGYCNINANFPLQLELDNVNSLLSEAEGKSIKATKDWSAVESQLQDVQVHMREQH